MNAAPTAEQLHLGKALDRARVGEDRAFGAQLREHGERLVFTLNGLLRMSRVHAPENQAFDQPVAELVVTVGKLVDLLGPVRLVVVEDQVYINEQRIRPGERVDVGRELAPELVRHNVGGVTFHDRVNERQVRAVLACFMANPDEEAPRTALGRALQERGVLGVELVGVQRFKMSREIVAGTPRAAAERVSSVVTLVDETFQNLGAGRRLNPLPLRRAVTDLLQVGPGPELASELPPGGSGLARHSARVAILSLAVGRAVGLNDETLQDLGVSALCHDLGYALREGASAELGSVGYPPTHERHTTATARLLLRQQGFHTAKIHRLLVALEHHRPFNGSAKHPSLLAMVVHLAEEYDSLTRSGAVSASPAHALGALVARAGEGHHPALVQVLSNILGRYPPGTHLALEDGRVVCVVSAVRSPETFAKPLARVTRAANRQPVDHGPVVDLAKEGRVSQVVPAPGNAQD
jgi:hypothetical protein